MKRIGNKDGNLKARTNVTCRSPRIWCNPYFSLYVLMTQERRSQLIFSSQVLFLSLHTHEVHICYFSDSLLVCKKMCIIKCVGGTQPFQPQAVQQPANLHQHLPK